MPAPRSALVLLVALVPACAGRDTNHAMPDAPPTSQREARTQSAPLGTSGGQADAAAVATAASEGKSVARLEEKESERDRSRAKSHLDDVSPLATQYGERHVSSVHGVDFTRAAVVPDLVLTLRYDGAARLGSGEFLSSGARVSGMSYSGPLSLSLLDAVGEPLHAVSLNGEAFAVGRVGERYMVGVENGSPERVEAVVSVDGLDVLDGSDAGFSKRGYLVDPFTSTMIEGWRTSYQEVAAFRFSTIEEGYGARTGRARNSGVVGVAFFHEQAPPQFAPPPPPRVEPHPDPFPGRR